MSSPNPSTPFLRRWLDPAFAARAVVGGLLMGLANLVPGISGGTMLLVAGVYPEFITAVAAVTTLRFRVRELALLLIIALAAGLAIVLMAGTVKDLVVSHRWIMYSLFIGLSLGGVPAIWRLLDRLSVTAVVGAVAALVAMTLLAVSEPGAAAESDSSAHLMLVIAGLCGGAAMILPGVSGGYLLLVLGQYVAILGAIHEMRELVGAGELSSAGAPARVLIAVAIGALIGVVGVSNLMKLLLARFPRPTLGVLLGLLLGAVVGLWPFEQPVEPQLGDIVKGTRIETVEQIADLNPEDWPTQRFQPGVGQAVASLVLILTGIAISLGIGRWGSTNRGNSSSAGSGSAAPSSSTDRS